MNDSGVEMGVGRRGPVDFETAVGMEGLVEFGIGMGR